MNPLLGILAPQVLEVGKQLIDRIWPDKEAQAAERQKAELELWRLTQSERMADKENEVKLALGQMEINKSEAENSNLFVSGWRPFIGWVCGVTFAYSFLIGPMITQISAAYGHSFPLPVIDYDNMIYILGGMLGIGGMRTWEKVKGVSTK